MFDARNENLKESSIDDNSTPFNRRFFLKILAAGAVVAANGFPRLAAAANSELVLADYGGSAEKAALDAYGDSVKKSLGLALVVDGSGPTAGKIRAMVEAKNVSWDIVDLEAGGLAQLGQAGLVEEIDYSMVDRSKVLRGLCTRWGVGSFLFSYIFAVNEKVAKGPIPKTWADFWNVKDFPGKRALPGFSQGTLEAALIADGVDPANLYPLDVDRAIAKIKQLLPHSIFWKSGAQSEDLLRQGEVLASLMWSNRAVVVRRTNPTITWTWDKAILSPAAWGVPKGNPAGKAIAMKFINLSLDPAAQAKVFQIAGMSPSNPAANGLIPAGEQRYNATAFANQQVLQDLTWYAEHGADAEVKYIKAIAS
jgi:putative spermidine/putrescine transport system substrate-binding protein